MSEVQFLQLFFFMHALASTNKAKNIKYSSSRQWLSAIDPIFDTDVLVYICLSRSYTPKRAKGFQKTEIYLVKIFCRKVGYSRGNITSFYLPYTQYWCRT